MMGNYPWTKRIGLGGFTLLASLFILALVLRLSNVSIAGIYPEAWLMGLMMTAPFTFGALSVAIIVTSLTETWRHRRRQRTDTDAD